VPSTHTSRTYEQELITLREKLALMGSLGESLIGQALDAYTRRDRALAERSSEMERRIDVLEKEVDELCLHILATRQPVASDLRFVTTALKVVTDLERIGDLGRNLCDRVIELCDVPNAPVPVDLEGLALETRSLLRSALDSLVERDSARATALLERDDLVDEDYARVLDTLLATMARDPSTVYRATRIQSIAKYLERIADHAMNVAERVVFLVNARDLRHMRSTPPAGPVRPTSG